MEITPTPPKPATIPSSSFVPSSGSPSAVPVDNQSAYSSDIAEGNALTIMGFSKAVISATNELNDTSWQLQQFNAASRKDMYLSSIEEMLALLQIYNKIHDITTAYSNAFQSNNAGIGNVNPEINAYNSGVAADNAQVATLNSAIAAYNAGTITAAQLQIAINTYNAYATPRSVVIDQTNAAINTYNTNLSGNNAAIEALKLELIAAGVSAAAINALNLPGTAPLAGELPTAPTVIPSPPMAPVTFPTPHTTLTPLTNTMNPKGQTDGTELAVELFTPFFDLMNGQFAITIDLLQNQSAFQGFIQFIFNNLPYLPATFYQPSPNLLVGGGGAGGVGGGGSGVSLASIITSLSTPLMEGIIAQGKFTAANALFSQPSTPEVVNQLQYLGLQLLSRVGLQAGSPALRLLEGRLPFIDLRASPVGAIIGANFLDELNQLVSSGAVLEGVKEILTKAYPNLDATSLNALALQLASATELFMLQAGLAQLAQALGNPDLFAQVISTIPSAKTEGTSAQPKAADILKDDIKRDALKRDVANATNISRDILTQAINNAIVDGDFSQGAFINSLVENGIVQNEAINAANIMQSYLKSEIIGRDVLDKSVSSNVLNKSVLANEAVNAIIKNRPDITNRELRDELVTQFVANGATPVEAISTATLAVTGRSDVNPVPSSLPDTLRAQGISQVAGIGLSPSESQAFANELVNTVLGPSVPGSQTSTRDLIDSRLQTLIAANDTNTTETARDSFQTFLAPTVELHVFADQLRDPANTFLYINQTGMMYSHPMPTNFKNSVEFLV